MVNIWFTQFGGGKFRVHEGEIEEDAVLENRRVRLKIPLPSFADYIQHGNWVIDLVIAEEKYRATAGRAGLL
jgi:hypothetical protein